jgi:hypothetical protein
MVKSLAEMKEKIGNLSFQNYRPNKKNILVIGPVPGQKPKNPLFIPFSEALKFFSSPIAGIFAGDVIFPRLFWEVNFFFF